MLRRRMVEINGDERRKVYQSFGAGMLRVRRSNRAWRSYAIDDELLEASLAMPVLSRRYSAHPLHLLIVALRRQAAADEILFHRCTENFFIQSGVIFQRSSNLSLAAGVLRILLTLTRPVSCPKLHLLHSMFQPCITTASLSDGRHPLA